MTATTVFDARKGIDFATERVPIVGRCRFSNLRNLSLQLFQNLSPLSADRAEPFSLASTHRQSNGSRHAMQRLLLARRPSRATSVWRRRSRGHVAVPPRAPAAASVARDCHSVHGLGAPTSRTTVERWIPRLAASIERARCVSHPPTRRER
jgi:hypothetical protein